MIMTIQKELKPWITLGTMGHVDHGKSTLCGFLLYEMGEVSESLLKKVSQDAEITERKDKTFAFIMDRLPTERGLKPDHIPQSIESAYFGFETKKNNIMIVDNPGHPQFIKNMIRGTSNIDVGLLAIAADDYEKALNIPHLYRVKHKGKKIERYVTGYARQHLIIAYAMGVQQLIVAVTKMDKVNFSKEVFTKIQSELTDLFLEIGSEFKKVSFIPTSINVQSRSGENITENSTKMQWHIGNTLLKEIESCIPPSRLVDKPLRVAIDGLYDVKGFKKVIGGRILSGTVRKGETVVIEPGNICAQIKSIKMRDEFKSLGRISRWEEVEEGFAGQLISFGLTGEGLEKIRIGCVLGSNENPPKVSYEFSGRVYVVWHPPQSEIRKNRKYPIFIGTSLVEGEVVDIKNKKSALGLRSEKSQSLTREELADIYVQLTRPVVIESYSDIPALGRFTFLIENIPSGGGVIVHNSEC
jgi:elongation factor 1-alpha